MSIANALRRNIELKARCPDLNAAREAARRLGAEFAGTLEQRDTYFVVPHGRLKLRQTAGHGAELVAYARANCGQRPRQWTPSYCRRR
jgi:adenylate cyclase class IV